MSALLIIIPILLGGLWASISERREWNDGICELNGLPWVYFDTDSQGGRGFKAGDIYTWFSWVDTSPEGKTGG